MTQTKSQLSRPAPHNGNAPKATTTRPAPNAQETEAALLGVMLLPGSEDVTSAALAICTADDFYGPAHGHICEAIASLHFRALPADPITVANELRTHGLLEDVGGMAALIALQANAPARTSGPRYAQIVSDLSKQRRLIGVAKEIAELGYSPSDGINAVLVRAYEMLATVARSPAGGLELFSVDQVETEKITWLWPSHLAAGKMTTIDGDPGLGKSTITLDLAARISTGSPMPDGHPLDGPADVILLSAEDGVADTIRPRLEAAGANLARVHTVDVGAADPVVLPARLAELERAVTAIGAALVIIDPFVAFLAADVNSYRDQDVRRVLAAIAGLAARTGAAVLLVRHLTKTAGGPAIYRGGGSIGIIGAARVGLLVGADPRDESRRLLAVSKCNLAPMAPTLAYRLVPDDEHEVGRIAWLGQADVSADQLVAPPAPPRTDEDAPALAGAQAFLADLLADGPLWSKQVKDETIDAGLAWATVRRAKDALNIRPRKVGRPGDAEQGWVWELLPEGAHPIPKVLTSTGRASSETLSIFGDPAGGNGTAPGPHRP